MALPDSRGYPLNLYLSNNKEDIDVFYIKKKPQLKTII